jgi:GntR family transcriptional repressor for pyruvate dehydrogenase complex
VAAGKSLVQQADWSAAIENVARRGAGGGERQRRSEVVQMIRDLISARGLAPGDRLPSERRLARQFGISRCSVREGLQYLSIMGLIEIRHGGGSYLLAPQAAPGQGRNRWRQWVVEHRGMVLETLELRLGSEVFAARLAAQRAGPEDIERLVAAMQAMREVCARRPFDTARFVECDIAFHDALLQAAGNRILRDLIRALSEQLLPERAAVTDLEGRAVKTYQEHHAIYEAVQSGNADAAAEAMARHIMSVRHDVLVRVLDEGKIESLTAVRGKPRNHRRRRTGAA